MKQRIRDKKKENSISFLAELSKVLISDECGNEKENQQLISFQN